MKLFMVAKKYCPCGFCSKGTKCKPREHHQNTEIDNAMDTDEGVIIVSMLRTDVEKSLNLKQQTKDLRSLPFDAESGYGSAAVSEYPTPYPSQAPSRVPSYTCVSSAL